MDCGRVIICSDHGDGLSLGVLAANGAQCDPLWAGRLWSAVYRVFWLNGRHVPHLCTPDTVRRGPVLALPEMSHTETRHGEKTQQCVVVDVNISHLLSYTVPTCVLGSRILCSKLAVSALGGVLWKGAPSLKLLHEDICW